MNRSSVISDIIDKRHLKQDAIRKHIQSLSAVESALKNLNDKATGLRRQLQSDPATCEALCNLRNKIEETEQIADRLRQELRRLEARTSRDTLNIGIVGVPKQGKSTFLQALTGLDEATIPTGSDFVTGACSYIRNNVNVPPGDAYAIVTPYSREEFLNEVLTPFCDKFGLHLNSIDDLPYLELPATGEMSEVDKRTLERLVQLKEGYNKYKDLLGRKEIRIPKDEIRLYVAQCDEKCEIPYTNWYAIRKAEIHCCFPQQDIGRIMICDTPGLGDFTPGAKRALMAKLGADMDVIFFMKRLIQSDQTISERDTEFYDVVQESNRVFKVDDWAYMMLNCSAGEEPSAIFRENLHNKLRTRQGAQVLNSKDPASVSEKFNSVLEDIVHQIPRLDTKLIENYETLTANLKKTLKDVADCARSAIPAYSPASSNQQADEQVEVILDQLLTAIESFKKELSEGTISLSPDIEKIINEMQENAPKLSYTARDAAQPIKWMAQGRDCLRAAYISAFSGLDASMERMITGAQKRLQEILTATDGGRLAFVTAAAEQEGTDFWQALEDILRSDLGENAEVLIQAIENVKNFKMQFRAFILPRLTAITEGLSNSPRYKDKSLAPFTDGDTIEDCKCKLETAWVRAIARSEALFDEDDGEMSDICDTPAKAIIALVDEFYLLWTRYQGEAKASAIWRSFYKAHAPEVWPEIYKSDTSMIAISRSWNAAIKTFTDAIATIY